MKPCTVSITHMRWPMSLVSIQTQSQTQSPIAHHFNRKWFKCCSPTLSYWAVVFDDFFVKIEPFLTLLQIHTFFVRDALHIFIFHARNHILGHFTLKVCTILPMQKKNKSDLVDNILPNFNIDGAAKPEGNIRSVLVWKSSHTFKKTKVTIFLWTCDAIQFCVIQQPWVTRDNLRWSWDIHVPWKDQEANLHSMMHITRLIIFALKRVCKF